MKKILAYCRLAAYPLIFCLITVQLPRLACAQEQITITTYYPSPFGSYQDLTVARDLSVGETLYIGQGDPTPGTAPSPRIEFGRSNGAATSFHWNIDQVSTNSANPILRFFTEPNNSHSGTDRFTMSNNEARFIRSDGDTSLRFDDNDLEFFTDSLLGIPRLRVTEDEIRFIGRGANSGNLVLRANPVAPNNPGNVVFETSGGLQKAMIWTGTSLTDWDLYLSVGTSNAKDFKFGTNGWLESEGYEVQNSPGPIQWWDYLLQALLGGSVSPPSLTGVGPHLQDHIDLIATISAVKVIAAILIFLGLASSFSSLRYKQNVRTIDNALEKILKLRGVEFDWKESGKHDIGLIAEEVGEAFPELLTYGGDGETIEGFRPEGLIGALVEAVKAQQLQIEQLKAEIAELNKK